MRPATPPLALTEGQRSVLEGLCKSRTAPHRDVTRARALLLAADGVASTAIAARLGVSPASVVSWRARFAEEGLAKFGRVREGRGRKASIPAGKVEAIVAATLHEKPPGETHWSCRSMARAQGVSPATVQRIWSSRGLQPHRVQTFKLSNDKRFEEKLTDVVGLYLNPPDKAVVLCMDEKSQIQAYPGDDRGVRDGGQEADMPGSSSVPDGLSGVSPQQSRRPRTDGHERYGGPELAVFPIADAQQASWPRRRCFCYGRVRNSFTCKDAFAGHSNPG